MSTLSDFGAVAGGLMAGMKMKQSIDRDKAELERMKRQEERMGRQEQRQNEEYEWRRKDRERADQDRAKADEFIAGGSYGLQPGRKNTAEGMETDEQTVSVRTAAADTGMDYNIINQNGINASNRRMQAMTLNDPRAKAIAEQEYQQNYLKDMAAFKGDPMKDPHGYMNHAIKVSAAYAKPLTPEEASKYHAAQKAYEKEGARDALNLAHSGQYDEALAYYNKNGGHTFTKLEGVDEKSQSGPMGKRLYAYTAQGEKVDLGNTMDNMIGLGFGDEMLKRFYDANKERREDKKLDNDTTKANAAADRDRAAAAKDRAEANAGGGRGLKPTELESMVQHGVKELAIAHGAKVDSLGMVDAQSMQDKAAYRRDIAELEKRVRSGETPMSVVDDIMKRTTREATIKEGQAKGGKSAVQDMRSRFGY